MTTSTLAFGKANASGMLKNSVSRQTVFTRLSPASVPHCGYSTVPAPASKSTGNAQTPIKHDDPAEQRELFMNVLTANATKRDAKQYLARFKPPKSKSPSSGKGLARIVEERNARNRQDQDRLDRTGVNLGGLYAPASAIANTPVFTQPGVQAKQNAFADQDPLHVALVCLRAPETLDDATIEGVSLTLTQLVKLDMRIVIVLDCDGPASSAMDGLAHVRHQAERLSHAIGRHSTSGARFVCEALEVHGTEATSGSPKARVAVPNLLLEPLKRSVIPIIPSMAYTPSVTLSPMSTTSVMTALSALLSGLPQPGEDAVSAQSSTNTSLDRIIVLDTCGGIPSKARSDGAHVFINLEQEYSDITAELAEYSHEKVEHANSNVYAQHQSNLSMLQSCLAILPSASSALIITPEEAANSSQTSQPAMIGTGTRRQKNTLIHNLLTNKPTISSSLPMSRLASPLSKHAPTTPLTSTLVKRGMPVTIIPAAPQTTGWLPPPSGRTTLDLETDPRVDLPRLIHLIEDSFRRPLNVPHYLSRIRNRTAGLIIAGSYEGAAILTWESPPHAPHRLVPYLDKFAVLGTSQGSSGVADIVFQSMVRTCFPHGVCWRSRGDNPVNKWYFERAEGTWRIPESNWTMFWTGGGVVEGEERWSDYVGVCKSVGPSWADTSAVVD